MSFTLQELKKFVKKLPNHFYVVGSIIRNKPNPQDVDLICLHDMKEDLKWFQKNYNVQKVIKCGMHNCTFIISLNKKPLKINIWHATKENLPFTAMAYSYPRVFNIALRKKAKTMGLTLNQYGLFKKDKKVAIHNIKDIFKILKIPYRTPAQEEKKLYGTGLGDYIFKTLSNIYRKRNCNNKARDLQSGEYHPLCANFCGPGTKIEQEKVKNYPPYNEVDEVCKIHDLDYNEANKLPKNQREKKIREADNKMLQSLERYKNLEPYYSLAKYAISAKMKAEDWIPFLMEYISPQHFGRD